MIHLLAEGGYQGFFLGSTEKVILLAALVASVASVVTALFLARGVLAADQGTASMKDIAKAIQEGAEAFLSRQFKTILIIIVPLAVLIFFTATKVTHTGANGQTIVDL
ncbi:MAG TPA: sodium/proton-translocating pyrophosphatase, partial [Acidimicrobiales bacterium]